jgi:hypothetical protein
VTAAPTRTDPWTRIAQLWPLLATTRIPGTPRPWRPAELTSEQREDRDAQLRVDRHMAEIFLEAQPAPLHLDVLDTLSTLHAALLGASCDLEAGDGVNPPARMVAPRPCWPSAVRDPSPLIDWCRSAARSMPDGIPLDHAAWDILHSIETALSIIYDRQHLAADCPWCHGGIQRKPSWRVRLLPGQMPAIVCESGICTPPEQDAGTWWRGNPAWPLWEWEWLAQRVEAAERKAGTA